MVLVEKSRPVRDLLLFFLLPYCLINAATGSLAQASEEDTNLKAKCYWEYRTQANITGGGEPDTIVGVWIRIDNECNVFQKENPGDRIYVKYIRPDGTIFLERVSMLSGNVIFEPAGTARRLFESVVTPMVRMIPEIGEQIEATYNLYISEKQYRILLKENAKVFGVSGGYFDYITYYYYDDAENKAIKVMTVTYPG